LPREWKNYSVTNKQNIILASHPCPQGCPTPRTSPFFDLSFSSSFSHPYSRPLRAVYDSTILSLIKKEPIVKRYRVRRGV
jgi:hypothetical protein